MAVWDRLLRSLFVATGVGLGWGIRGDFGHSLGAMAPGATLGLAFAYATGQRSAMKWMPILGGLAAFFISIGGMMSYGILHGYAQSDTLLNYSYGFFTLILQGGAWGGYCGAALGLALERERLKIGELISAIVTAYAAGWIFYFLVVELIGFHINPPRSDLSINFTGQMIALFFWMAKNRKWIGLRGLALGYMGFGLGMALSRLAGNAMANAPFAINHWNVMEVGCGAIGGFVFAFGMLGRRLDDLPDESGWSTVSFWSILYIMGFIPLLHRLNRIDPEKKIDEWTNAIRGYGVADRETAMQYAEYTLWALDGVCVLGFVAAAIWVRLWRKDRWRWGAYPVLTFNLLMLVFQNLSSLYLFEKFPEGTGHVNMHNVFWWLYGFMLLFVLAFETIWPRREIVVEESVLERIPWPRWVVTCVILYLAILVGAWFTNGDVTMRAANTRWPIWVWTQGPFPGRGK